MKLQQILQELLSRGKTLYESARGRNIATFSVFLLISALFWLIMKMNDVQQRDFNLQVEIKELPKDVTLLTSELPVVNVSLRDKGSSLLRYSWGKVPNLSFNFLELPSSHHKLVIGTLQTNNAVRQIFSNATIGGVKPDSILIPYTTRPGKQVKIKIETGDITVDERYIQSGELKLLTDSVKLYSVNAIPKNMRTLHTVPVNAYELTDTTIVVARLEVPAGMRAIPEEVRIQIPVEPLIAAEKTVDIKIEGAPSDVNIVPFTRKVTVNYLVPLSRYNGDNGQIKVFADYKRRNRKTSRMPVSIVGNTDYYRNLTISPDSIEFILESDK